MTPCKEPGWTEVNQRQLVDALAEIRIALEEYVARSDSGARERTAGDRVAAAYGSRGSDSPRSAVDQLSITLRLSPFERALLLLCAGVELDARFAPLCAKANGDSAKPWPTFGLALAALPEPHWSALIPAAPLRHWRLIELSLQSGVPLTTTALRIDERILHYLAGLDYPDERLTPLLDPIETTELLVPSHRKLADRIAAEWSKRSARAAVVELCGSDPETRRAIAHAATRLLGMRLLVMSAEVIPTGSQEMDGLARLWDREAALAASALYVDADGQTGADSHTSSATARFLERLSCPVLLGTGVRRGPLRRSSVVLDVRKPTRDEQKHVWESFLGPVVTDADGCVPRLASHFDLTIGAIGRSVNAALSEDGGEDQLPVRLWNASCAQARPRLEDLAQRIEPRANWADLVLPDAEQRQLQEIAIHLSQRAKVYDDWGFAKLSTRGLGITSLFSGASGTGKTMAAEVLANHLRLDLYRIDLASTVSKYIGETEKNLRRVFDAADNGGAILFFDEADALFGKRSEVKDSHDRYANIEVNYLLQRMEAYRGLAILATNMKSALDSAFLRRIRFVVNFPFPDAALRARIWQRVFPVGVPIESLEWNELARPALAGGSIRNIALNAAFLAADADQPVRMSHLARATRSEFAKLDKPLNEADIAGWKRHD